MSRRFAGIRVIDDLNSLHRDRYVRQNFWSIDKRLIAGREGSLIDTVCDVAVASALEPASGRQYLFRAPRYGSNRSMEIFDRDFNDEKAGDQLPSLNNDAIIENYQNHKSSFWQLVQLVEDHPIFGSATGFRAQRKQAPIKYRLLVFLFYLGTSEKSYSNWRLRNMFGIGRGIAQLYWNRCTVAVCSFRKDSISWPEEDDRKEIAKQIFITFRCLDCIAVADGTRLPLACEPQSNDPLDYKGREHIYSPTVMIFMWWPETNSILSSWFSGECPRPSDLLKYSSAKKADRSIWWKIFSGRRFCHGIQSTVYQRSSIHKDWVYHQRRRHLTQILFLYGSFPNIPLEC